MTEWDRMESETEFAVRAEANEIQVFIVGFAVDQNEIGPDVAVAVIGPFTNQRMIDTLNGQGYV